MPSLFRLRAFTVRGPCDHERVNKVESFDAVLFRTLVGMVDNTAMHGGGLLHAIVRPGRG